MDWNAEWYENKHGFVAEYDRELLSCVPENPAQSILNLGCGRNRRPSPAWTPLRK